MDPLRTAHRGIGAGCAQSASLLGAEVPVEQRDQRQRQQRPRHHRLRNIERGEQEAPPLCLPEETEFFDAGGLVRFSHHAQVDGIERKLREDPRQDHGNPQLRVQQSRTDAAQNAGRRRDQQRAPARKPREHQHDGDRAAGGKGAVNAQIRHVEQAKRDQYAQRHDPPDDALRDACRHAREQVCDAEGGKVE